LQMQWMHAVGCPCEPDWQCNKMANEIIWIHMNIIKYDGTIKALGAASSKNDRCTTGHETFKEWWEAWMARPMLATMVGAMKLSSRIRQVARMQSDVILGDDRSKEGESLSRKSRRC
jgi:hypothetical protein